jgi:hypothetical protein
MARSRKKRVMIYYETTKRTKNNSLYKLHVKLTHDYAKLNSGVKPLADEYKA